MCKYSGEEIAAYLDGEISPDVRSELKKHLTTCGDCQRELHVQQAVKRTVKQSFSHWVAPGALKSRLHRAIEACPDETGDVRIPRPLVRFPFFRWYGLFPSAVAAAVILFLFLPGFPSSDVAPIIFANSQSFIRNGALLASSSDFIRVLDIDESGTHDEDIPDFSFNGLTYKKSVTFMIQNVRSKLVLYQQGARCLCLWLFECTGQECEQMVDAFFHTNRFAILTDKTVRQVCPRTNKMVYLTMLRGEMPARGSVFALVGVFSHPRLLYLANALSSSVGTM